MTICPICARELGLTSLRASALDVSGGELFNYMSCQHCSVLVLQNPPALDGDVDYSESGYYRKEHIRGGWLFDAIIAIYTAHRIRVARNAAANGSLDGKRILDIGCGKGRFLEQAQKLGAEVSGVEPTRRSYDAARIRLGDAVRNTVMADNLFAAGYFDVVTMWHVFEHLSAPVSMLNICRRVLKPGGKLILAVPNCRGFIAMLGGPVWFNLDPPRHLVHYDVSSLTSLLRQAGFEVEEVNHHYPELTYMSVLQTLLNKLPVTNNFLFNYLKRNSGALPVNTGIYLKDLMLTWLAVVVLAPVAFFMVPVLSFLGKSDCITLIAKRR